jgi:hypothetical protein
MFWFMVVASTQWEASPQRFHRYAHVSPIQRANRILRLPEFPL